MCTFENFFFLSTGTVPVHCTIMYGTESNKNLEEKYRMYDMYCLVVLRELLT